MPETTVRSVDSELPVLLVPHRCGIDFVAVPNIVVTVTAVVMEVSVGRVGRQPNPKQVRVVLVAGTDLVLLLGVVVRVVISTTFHVKKTEQVCIVRVPNVGGVVCRVASDLDSMIFCHETEVDANGTDRFKMGRDLPVGNFVVLLTNVG